MAIENFAQKVEELDHLLWAAHTYGESSTANPFEGESLRNPHFEAFQELVGRTDVTHVIRELIQFWNANSNN